MGPRGLQQIFLVGLILSLLLICTKISSTNALSADHRKLRRRGQALTIDERTRDVVNVEEGPQGVIWVVQMSDIHISRWVPERGIALRKALGRALNLIRPAIVLVTGDLTDAKNKDRTATRQDETEWIEYRDSFQKVADDSGIPLKNFYDLRGNHDKYGVPLMSTLDYHSKYSISASLNRSSLVQSVTVMGRGGRKHLLVGFDDSMIVGLRGPSNVFGHPTDDVLAALDLELSRWNLDTSEPVTKIVYGHFPMSFTASTSTGKRPEEVMAKHGVTAYVCGHLHTKFGRRLYKHHKVTLPDSKKMSEFWEWEMGDWRASRMMRVLAIDQGYTSFTDIELIPTKDTSGPRYTMPTVILITYPLDARFMLQSSDATKSATESIRALVFCETTPVSVRVRIYNMALKHPELLDELNMELIPEGSTKNDGGAYIYRTPWNKERYVDKYGRKYGMQVLVRDTRGSISTSEMRHFSANGVPSKFRLTPLAFLVMGYRVENAYPALLWAIIFISLSSLVLPKLFLLHLHRGGGYEAWMASIFTPAENTQSALGKVVKVPFWAILEGCRNNYLWLGLMAYLLSLVFFPWFSGRILADDYPIGHMSIHGWTVKASNVSSSQTISGLGVPDILATVLPYLYGVLLPLLLMLSALSAERAACEFHVASLGKCQKKRNFMSEYKLPSETASETEASQGSATSSSDETITATGELPIKEECKLQSQGELETLLLKKRRDRKDHYCSLCNRLVRKGLFIGCLAVAFIHWRLCSAIVGAYGPTALVAAPAYAWGVPALLIFSLFQTSKIRAKPPGHEH